MALDDDERDVAGRRKEFREAPTTIAGNPSFGERSPRNSGLQKPASAFWTQNREQAFRHESGEGRESGQFVRFFGTRRSRRVELACRIDRRRVLFARAGAKDRGIPVGLLRFPCGRRRTAGLPGARHVK